MNRRMVELVAYEMHDGLCGCAAGGDDAPESGGIGWCDSVYVAIAERVLAVMSPLDGRDCIYVATDHNPDDVRAFYEVPDVLAVQVRATNPAGTFAQGLADMLGLIRETAAEMDEARRLLGGDSA